jgi:hypothetical protein
MDAEDGLIWVYAVGDDGVMAFTDFGIETLMELVRAHKESPKTCSQSTSIGNVRFGFRPWGTSNICQTPQGVVRKSEMGLREPMFDAGTIGGGSGFLAFLKSQGDNSSRLFPLVRGPKHPTPITMASIAAAIIAKTPVVPNAARRSATQ